jgi:hypothetical protein
MIIFKTNIKTRFPTKELIGFNMSNKHTNVNKSSTLEFFTHWDNASSSHVTKLKNVVKMPQVLMARIKSMASDIVIRPLTTLFLSSLAF